MSYRNAQSIVVFVINLLAILMVFYKMTHLKSSFDKTKYIFDQSIWECNGHFDHWFQILRFFCVAYRICTGRNFIL